MNISSQTFKFNVQTSSGTYPVIVANQSLDKLGSLLKDIQLGPKVSIIQDENVEKLYSPRIEKSLGDYSPNLMTLPSGETSKSFSVLYPYFQELIEAKLDRHSTLIALGGGVTGDAVGFLASTYLRGIDFIQIPTTLLSMVDSSIGGKVGINHELGKNLIGAFHPPKLVVIDPSLLTSLPEREYLSGLGECIKHALISGHTLFEESIALKEKLKQKDLEILPEFIYNNLQVKKNIVEADEKEAGVRAFLNLGHTFAHALENYFNYGTLLHGEAVCLGLICALRMSEEVFNLDSSVRVGLIEFLKFMRLPTKVEGIETTQLIKLMTRDKKTICGKTNFVLLKNIGEPVLFSDVSEGMLDRAWEEIRE